MVWGLFPVDHVSGEDKYYIFKKGTFKVGRKGCDVIIKDKGVSRIHAEIIVDGMTVSDLQSKVDLTSGVRIKDCSKYGTLVRKGNEPKKKIHDSENKGTDLKDGDLVTFGTSNAEYRFSFVPLLFLFYGIEPFRVNHPLWDKILSIGGCIIDQLNEECTHVLVDELMPVKEDLLDAIVSNKIVVLQSWIEFLAEKSICSEFPGYNSHVPTLTLEGVPIKIVDSRTRARCLEGYTCILGSSNMYKFGTKLLSVFQLGGAKVLFVEDFCSSSQGFEVEENDQVICIIPFGSVDMFDRFSKLSALCRVSEVDLLRAVLSGHLDSSVLISPSVLVSSSCSTDETIVADSDAETETETATSDKSAANICSEKCVKQAEIVTTLPSPILEGNPPVLSWDGQSGRIARKEKMDESEIGNSDVIYSQDLIARHPSLPTIFSSADARVVNFKCFRKKNTQSGNSFSSLIPFSKYPYKESDYQDQEKLESMKEEKKRKQLEAVAEDLFNNEKGKRRGVVGSLHGRLTRR